MTMIIYILTLILELITLFKINSKLNTHYKLEFYGYMIIPTFIIIVVCLIGVVMSSPTAENLIDVFAEENDLEVGTISYTDEEIYTDNFGMEIIDDAYIKGTFIVYVSGNNYITTSDNTIFYSNIFKNYQSKTIINITTPVKVDKYGILDIDKDDFIAYNIHYSQLDNVYKYNERYIIKFIIALLILLVLIDIIKRTIRLKDVSMFIRHKYLEHFHNNGKQLITFLNYAMEDHTLFSISMRNIKLYPFLYYKEDICASKLKVVKSYNTLIFISNSNDKQYIENVMKTFSIVILYDGLSDEVIFDMETFISSYKKYIIYDNYIKNVWSAAFSSYLKTKYVKNLYS